MNNRNFQGENNMEKSIEQIIYLYRNLSDMQQMYIYTIYIEAK
jgi:hypothetical protein